MKNILMTCALIASASLFAYADGNVKNIDVPTVGPYAQIDVNKSNQAIQVLKAGDDASKKTEIQAIISHPGDYNPAVLYFLGDTLFRQGQTDDGVFWFYAGHLRGKFDENLCADQSAKTAVRMLDMRFGAGINLYASQDLDKLGKTIGKILDWDKTTPYHYDHRWINLHGMQAMQYSFESQQGKAPGTVVMSAPQAQWEQIHQKTREQFLDEINKAIEILKKQKGILSQQGIADTDTSVGISLLTSGSNGSLQDAQQAIVMLSKAAGRGNPLAELYLGIAYERGIGVSRDADQAIQWLTKSAQAGIPQARQELQTVVNTKELISIPPGFLVPAQQSIPKGLKESKHAYRQDFYYIQYNTHQDKLLPAGKSPVLQIQESAVDADVICKTYDFQKNIQTFSYNGVEGKIVTVPSGTSPSEGGDEVSYMLHWKDQGKCVNINYNNLPVSEAKPQEVIDILKSMARSQ